ncbi:CRISPR-associated endonuclease Cas2 [Pseudahrensia aquimaris]|uniref:CRISPR-associated endoribonuclease Cas2 n=1 Tax=Pseudahrensia aquimaris TaxID=744461 RepID=A0ABW3FAY4_9HYPH
MARNDKLRVFCYDISCDRRRRRVARILEDAASRVQFSVFESRMNKAKMEKLCARIEPILDEGDSLRIYTIGKTGERQCQAKGATTPIEREANYWLF